MGHTLPKDPFILLSYVNTQLRDSYASLEELCRAMDIEQEELSGVLKGIGYEYRPQNNQFC